MEYMSREDYCETNCGKENRDGYKTCYNCHMTNVPTTNVPPVKCGHWIAQLNGHVFCSYCGKEQAFCSDFCKHCGADMRGENDA